MKPQVRFILCAIVMMASVLTALAQTPTTAQATPTPAPPTVVYEGTGKPMVVKSVTPDNKITVGFAKLRAKMSKKTPAPAAAAPAPTAVTTIPTTPTPTVSPAPVAGWWEKNGLLLLAMLLLAGLLFAWMWWQNQTSQRHHEWVLAEIAADRNEQRMEQQAPSPASSVVNHFTVHVNGAQHEAPTTASAMTENDTAAATKTETNET